MTDPNGHSSPHARSRPRVVMLLANEFTHDTRVYKEARSLIEWGCEVHIVAMARPPLPPEEMSDGIHVHRVTWARRDIIRIGLATLFWSFPHALRWLFPALVVKNRPRVPTEVDTPSPSAAASATGESSISGGATGGSSGESSGGSSGGMEQRIRAHIPAPMRPAFGVPYRAVRWVVRGVRRAIWLAKRHTITRVRNAIRGAFPTSFNLLAFNTRCVRCALALEPDVIQAHDLNTLLAGAVVKQMRSVPFVYDSHELFLERNLGNQSRARDHLVWAPIERFCIHKCDAVFSVAEGICRHLADQYNISTPHLIRNVQPYERPAEPSSLLADEFGIPRAIAVVLYPGAITINRGLEQMIDSAPHLEGAVYVIMGYARNAAYLDSLKHRAKCLGVLNESVFFRDAVPINDVVRYTASADLGIVPTQNICRSYYFESSNKIFHCLMAGVPVVMSDHAEKRLLVEEYNIGWLFDETDPEDIAATVNAVLTDLETYHRAQQQCLRAARTLNWEHEEHRLRTIFTELLGDRVPPVPDIVFPADDVQVCLESSPAGAAAPAP